MPLNSRTTKQNMRLTDIFVLIGLLWFNGGVLYGGTFGFGAAVNLLVFLIAGVMIVFTDSRFFKKLFGESGFLWGVLFFFTMLFAIIKNGTLLPEAWEIIYALMILVYAIYLTDRSLKVKKTVVYVLLIDRLLVTFRTFVVLEIDPNASRYLASSSEALVEQGLSAYMVANFAFVYSTVIILTVLFFIRRDLFNSIGLFEKIFLLVYVIASVLLIIRASYTAAILVLALMLVLSFVFNGRNGVWSAVKLAILLIAVYYFSFIILEWARDTIFEDTAVAARLDEVINLLKGNSDEASDAMNRFDRFVDSLDTFSKNPVFGVFEKSDSADVELGMHSEWIDNLAMFGILRYPIFIAFLVKSAKFVISKSARYTRGIGWVYICLFILGVLNPIMSQHTYLALYIFVPLMSSIKSENEEKLYAGRHFDYRGSEVDA